MKDVIFEAGGQSLKGSIFYPEESKDTDPAVLFLHGWSSNRVGYAEYAQHIAGLGFVSLTYDMRGHGESEGDINLLTRKDFLEDAIAAYDFLRAHKIDTENITVVGASFGGYLACLLTQSRTVRQLGLRAPANYPNAKSNEPQINQSGQVDLLGWRYKVANPQETVSLQALHGFDGSVLIVESEGDQIIPHQTIENYIDAIKDKSQLTHKVMKSAPHGLNTPSFRAEYLDILSSWLLGTN